MKSRIPLDLAREDGPGPNKDFSGRSNQSNFFCLAAANEAFVKRLEGILALHAAQSAHIKQTTHLIVAHFGDAWLFAHRAATFVGLGVETDKSSQTLGRALATGQVLPLKKLDHEGEDDFRTDAWQGQKTRQVLLERLMALAELLNGLLDFLESVFQGINDLLKTLPNLGRNAGTIHRFGQTRTLFLERLLQVITSLEQAIQLRDFNSQRWASRRVTFGAVMSQNACIDTIRLGSIAYSFGPIAYLFGIRHAHQPALLIRIGDQRRFITTRRLDDQMNLLGTICVTKRFDLLSQRLTSAGIIRKRAQLFCRALHRRTYRMAAAKSFFAISTPRINFLLIFGTLLSATLCSHLLDVLPEGPTLPGIRALGSPFSSFSLASRFFSVQARWPLGSGPQSYGSSSSFVALFLRYATFMARGDPPISGANFMF